MKIIIGLGNPGEKYISTRHNLGLGVVEELGRKMTMYNVQFTINKKLKAEILKIPDAILTKPLTFMNNSGQAAKALTDYFKTPISDVVVIHDDLDLPLGKIKVRLGGSSGGHKGVESIIKSLGTDQFIRVRLGISTLTKHHNVEKFVVEPFLSSEKSQAKQMIKKAVLAVELILDKGLEKAQNQYN